MAHRRPHNRGPCSAWKRRRAHARVLELSNGCRKTVRCSPERRAPRRSQRLGAIQLVTFRGSSGRNAVGSPVSIPGGSVSMGRPHPPRVRLLGIRAAGALRSERFTPAGRRRAVHLLRAGRGATGPLGRPRVLLAARNAGRTRRNRQGRRSFRSRSRNRPRRQPGSSQSIIRSGTCGHRPRLRATPTSQPGGGTFLLTGFRA
jgi:hypothetical protein